MPSPSAIACSKTPTELSRAAHVVWVATWLLGACASAQPEPQTPAPITIGEVDAADGSDVEYSATPHAGAVQPPRDDGLVIEDLEVGSGDEVVSGSTVVVHYVGALTDGSVFDSSRERARPFSVTIGKNRVIRGWEEGLLGMRVGGVRRLTIPPELGYGASGHPPKIPPNSTLVFEIELLGIE